MDVGERVDPAQRDGRARGEARAASRERLIRAAVELAEEHHESGAGLRDVFAYLTPSAVAERAGLSRGLIYHHWGDSEGDGIDPFARFLTAVSDELFAAAAVPEDLASLADQLPANLSDVLLVLAEAEMSRYTGPDSALVRASQALVIHGVWPQDDARTVLERLTALYTRLGARLGREPVPPLDFSDVALAMMSVFEGFALFHDVFPERLASGRVWQPSVSPSDPEATWTLQAIALEGVVANLTRPIDRSGSPAAADAPAATVSDPAA